MKANVYSTTNKDMTIEQVMQLYNVRDAKHLATLLEERKTLITIINNIHKQTNI